MDIKKIIKLAWIELFFETLQERLSQKVYNFMHLYIPRPARKALPYLGIMCILATDVLLWKHLYWYVLIPLMLTGAIDYILISLVEDTITKHIRKAFGKVVDKLIMIARIVLVGYFCGWLAVLFAIHFTVNGHLFWDD